MWEIISSSFQGTCPRGRHGAGQTGRDLPDRAGGGSAGKHQAPSTAADPRELWGWGAAHVRGTAAGPVGGPSLASPSPPGVLPQPSGVPDPSPTGAPVSAPPMSPSQPRRCPRCSPAGVPVPALHPLSASLGGSTEARSRDGRWRHRRW